MANIIPMSGNSSDLLALAEELDIDLDQGQNDFFSGGQSKMTSYSKPKTIRTIFDSHNSKGVIKWTPAGFSGDPTSREEEYLFVPDENGGEPRDLGNVVEVRGLIVDYQQRDELRYYDGEKTNILCSVIGYENNGSVVKDLPRVPYGMKHTFEKDKGTGKWSVNDTKPNPAVEKLGLVGYRGERPTSCAECIKCGMSTEVIPGIGDNGADKKISCEARAKLFMAVFEVAVKKKVKEEGKVKGKAAFVDTLVVTKVSDLLDLNGESIGDFFLLEVPMSKSSIQGKYVKNAQGKKDVEGTVEGYESFARGLTYQFKNPKDPLRLPKFHYTKLTFRENPGKAPTFQADFRSLGAVTPDQFKSAHAEWTAQVPERTVETLDVEPIQRMQQDGTIDVAVAAVVDTTPAMRTVTEVVNEVDEDVIPF